MQVFGNGSWCCNQLSQFAAYLVGSAVRQLSPGGEEHTRPVDGPLPVNHRVTRAGAYG